jgi:hypothetical protein
MITNKLRVLFAIAGIVLLSAAEAHAANWSTSFKIDFMETDAVSGGYSIVPVAGSFPNSAGNDPANCVAGTSGSIDRIYFLPGAIDVAGKELIARTLLAAYMAGKSVKLHVSSNTCVLGRPSYGNVAVYP